MKKIMYYPLFFMYCAAASAGTLGTPDTSKKLHPMLTLQGGYAAIHANDRSQRFEGDDSNLFIYMPARASNNTGFIGLFLGGEYVLPQVSKYPFLLQAGFEYNAFGKLNVKGINTVGVDPGSSTQYTYNYNVKTQQVLGGIKLLTTAYKRLHPYGEAGLGIAINRADTYQASTTETGSLNATPVFADRSTVRLSYILGVGLDANVNTHIRTGIGYRYSDLGTASLGNGSVSVGANQTPVPFAVKASNLYANQVIAHVSYIA